MNEKITKPITLRRDGKGPLKFTGERIGDANRTRSIEDDSGDLKSYEISTRLYRTPSKYVVGIEVYNRTDEKYDTRYGWFGASLEELRQEMKQRSSSGAEAWFDDDILAELFEKTEIANHFVEQID
jgi:hypothetical protein